MSTELRVDRGIPALSIRHEAGFTLLDLLVGLSLLFIAILGMTDLTTTVIKGNSKSERVTSAILLANERLEDIRLAGYNNAESLDGTEGYGTIEDYPSFRRVTSTSLDTPEQGNKTVAVAVFWDSNQGSTSLSTIIGIQGKDS